MTTRGRDDAQEEDTPEDNQPFGSKKEMAQRLAELERRLNELEADRD